MPPLVALEAMPFGMLLLLLLVPCVDVHRLSLTAKCLLRYQVPTALCVATQVSTRGTCCAACSILRTAGSGNLFEAPGLLVVASVALTNAVGLVVGVVPLSFLVHDEDPLLPLVVILGNSYPDAGDDRRERPWDSLSHGGDHRSAAISVVVPSRQLGFAFQLLEEDGGGIASHLHVLHVLLVFLLAGGVSEHGLELGDKVILVRVSESGSGRISIVIDPEVFSSVGPPVLGVFDEEGGGADHHE